MARVTHGINLTVSSDPGGTLPAFSRDSGLNPALRVISDRFDDFESGSLLLPSSGTPRVLSLGALADVRGYYFEVQGTGPCLLWVNAEGEVEADTPGGILLRSASAPGESATFAHSYQDAAVTSLAAASTSGAATRVAYAVWGFSQAQPT